MRGASALGGGRAGGAGAGAEGGQATSLDGSTSGDDPGRARLGSRLAASAEGRELSASALGRGSLSLESGTNRAAGSREAWREGERQVMSTALDGPASGDDMRFYAGASRSGTPDVWVLVFDFPPRQPRTLQETFLVVSGVLRLVSGGTVGGGVPLGLGVAAAPPHVFEGRGAAGVLITCRTTIFFASSIFSSAGEAAGVRNHYCEFAGNLHPAAPNPPP